MKQYTNRLYNHPDFLEGGKYWGTYFIIDKSTNPRKKLRYGEYCNFCHTPLAIHNNGTDCSSVKHYSHLYPVMEKYLPNIILNSNVKIL